MKKEDDISLGKFISLILRHKPEKIGITIEKQGAWANVSELIEGMNKVGKKKNMVSAKDLGLLQISERRRRERRCPHLR